MNDINDKFYKTFWRPFFYKPHWQTLYSSLTHGPNKHNDAPLSITTLDIGIECQMLSVFSGVNYTSLLSQECHDIQHNGTQANDIQHNDPQYRYTRHRYWMSCNAECHIFLLFCRMSCCWVSWCHSKLQILPQKSFIGHFPAPLSCGRAGSSSSAWPLSGNQDNKCLVESCQVWLDTNM